MIHLLYQDASILVADKPHDLLSVPGRAPDNRDCLLSRLQADFPTARIVHRLDCATSGVMVLALDADSHRHLSRQFQERQIGKQYIAHIHGRIEDDKGQVNLPLRCDWENRPKQIVDHAAGKTALTHWRILHRQADYTRVQLTPVTGRSHQLRVHMQQLGHPILGDRFYAHPEALAAADRLLLHALQLELTHPVSGERLSFQAPCPF